MKNLSLLACAVGALLCACGGKSEHPVTNIDLGAAAESENFCDVAFEDVTYTPLDTATAALFSERGQIIGVAGDTVIIHDMTDTSDRLILFTLSDGKMVGQISHVGNGPGEYRWIETVFLDRPAHELVINTADNIAHRYTFDDRYLNSMRYDTPSMQRLSIGSLEKGIYEYQMVDSGFIIHCLDRNFRQTDSIFVRDYQLGYQSGIFCNAGGLALISMVDTVYSITPGALEPIAILSTGGKTITPEIEKKLSSMPWENQRAEMQNYINKYWVIPDDNYLLVPYQYHDAENIDIFRRDNGKHVAHKSMSWEVEEPQGLEVKWGDNTFHALPMYVQDGIWYAIISPEEAVGADGREGSSDELNAGILTFRMAPANQ